MHIVSIEFLIIGDGGVIDEFDRFEVEMVKGVIKKFFLVILII